MARHPPGHRVRHHGSAGGWPAPPRADRQARHPGGRPLVTQASRRDLSPWFDGIVEGTGLTKGDPRLHFRRIMFAHTRKQAGAPMRRRETREHITLYLKAFNAWTTNTPLTQLRYTPREPVPPIATH